LVGIKAKRSSTLTDSASSLGKKEKETPLLAAAGSKRSLANQDDAQIQPLNRDDAFYTGSLQRLPQYRENPASYHASVTRVLSLFIYLFKCFFFLLYFCFCFVCFFQIPEVVEETDGKKKSNGCMRAVSSLIQFSLFKSPSFNLLCFSSFITFLGFFVPFMFLAARAEQLGADKESASFLLSIIGITNTLGRVACGALSDHPKVNVLMVNNAALTLGGVVTIATPFFPAYEMLIVYACLFGLSIGLLLLLPYAMNDEISR
jgi:nitrate/nitrite transporter NarK